MEKLQNIRIWKGEITYTTRDQKLGKLAIDQKDAQSIFKNRKNTERLEAALAPLVKKVTAANGINLVEKQPELVASNTAYLIMKKKPSELFFHLETGKGEPLELVQAPSRWKVLVNSFGSFGSIRWKALVNSFGSFGSRWQDAMLNYAFQIEHTIKILADDALDHN